MTKKGGNNKEEREGQMRNGNDKCQMNLQCQPAGHDSAGGEDDRRRVGCGLGNQRDIARRG